MLRCGPGVESESNALRIGLRVGHRMPAYCTAGGRAMLAELTNDKVEEIYRGGLPSWPAARITTISALKRRLGTVRRDGYAACFEEHERGVVSFGVAVTSGGTVVCSLAYAIPTVRYRRADRRGTPRTSWRARNSCRATWPRRRLTITWNVNPMCGPRAAPHPRQRP